MGSAQGAERGRRAMGWAWKAVAVMSTGQPIDATMEVLVPRLPQHRAGAVTKAQLQAAWRPVAVKTPKISSYRFGAHEKLTAEVPKAQKTALYRFGASSVHSLHAEVPKARKTALYRFGASSVHSMHAEVPKA